MTDELDDIESSARDALLDNENWYDVDALIDNSIHAIDAKHIAANSPELTIRIVSRVRTAEKERDDARAEVQKLRDELAAFAAAVTLDIESRPQVADLDLSTQVEIPASLASERRTSDRRASDRRESRDSMDGKNTARIAIPETMEDVIEGGLR